MADHLGGAVPSPREPDVQGGGGPSALAGVAVVVATIGVTSAALIAARSTGITLTDPWILASVMLFGIAGGVLLVRRPGHRVAWVLSIVGIGGSLASLGAGLGSGDSVADALVGNSFLDAGPLRLVGIAFGNAGWWMFVVGVIGLLPLLFPTGDVPSPRWRPVLWTLTAALALMVLLGVATPELCQFTDSAGLETGDEVCVDNPIGVPGLPPAEVGILVAFPASLAAIAGLVLRFRRSDSVERAQLKWLSFALVMLLVLSMGEAVLEGVGSNLTANLGFFDPLGIALVMVPVSIVVAVTRYRLFEIDRLISRTVSYAVVLLVLAAVFALLVLVPTALLGGRETPSWIVAGATLAAAGLFSPLRARARALIDRRFDRARYDAEATVARMGAVMAEAATPGTIGGLLAQTASDAFRPNSVGVWLTEAEE